MKGIKGSRTEQNLLKSFAGESQARNRYDMFAKQARKDGFEQIAAVFEETAVQEQQHARRMFDFLEGGMVEITAMYPAGKVGSIWRTCGRQRLAKTRNGPVFIRNLPRLLGKRVSSWLRSSMTMFALPKSIMKSATRFWPAWLSPIHCSIDRKRLHGPVESAVTRMSDWMRPKPVRPVLIRRRTSSSNGWRGNRLAW